MSVFIDDFSTQTNRADHLSTLRECFLRCRRNGLPLNPTKPDLSGPVARWVLLLEEFDYKVEYKPGRLHKQADHLS